MKASAFPRMYRAFDLDRNIMLSPEALTKEGFTVAPDGLPSNANKPMFNIVLLWFSGQTDDERNPLFEGDICKVQVANEFGSVSTDYGIMRWNAQARQFILMIPSAQGGVMLDVKSVKLLGNEFENAELVPLVKNEEPENG